MVHKKLAVIFLAISTCTAMENTAELSGLIIQTQDDMFVEVPQNFVDKCSYLKNMLEGFSGKERAQSLPIKEVNGQALKTAITLVNLNKKNENSLKDIRPAIKRFLEGYKAAAQAQGFEKFELTVEDHLQPFDVISLAHLLTTVNFLDCKILFKTVLLSLTQKITQCLDQKVNASVYETLVEILPVDLQKIVQEILLIQNRLIQFFMTRSLKAEKAYPFLSSELFYTFDSTRRFLSVSDARKMIFIFDIAEHPAKQIASFESLNSLFSPDGKFMFVITDYIKSKFVLLDLTTRKQRTYTVQHSLYPFRFSEDSKHLIIDNRAYDVETGIEVGKSPLPLEGMSPRTLKVSTTGNKEHDELIIKHPELKKLLGKTNFASIYNNLQPKTADAKRIHVSDDCKYVCIAQPETTHVRYQWKLSLFSISESGNINELMQLNDIRNYQFNNSCLLVTGHPKELGKTYDSTLFHIGCYHFIPRTWTKYGETSSVNSHVFFSNLDNFFIETSRAALALHTTFSWCYYLKTINQLKKFIIFGIAKKLSADTDPTGIYFIDDNRVLIADEEPFIVTIPVKFLMKNYCLTEFLVNLAQQTNPLAMLSKEFTA